MIPALVRPVLPFAVLAACSSGPGEAAPTSRPAPQEHTKAAASLEVVHVDPARAREVLAKDSSVVVLDVRTPQEYQAGHLHGARNVNFLSESFVKELEKLPRDRPYLVHCRSGGRSTRALAVFEKLGFRKVFHLDGGILAWQKAGLPLEKK